MLTCDYRLSAHIREQHSVARKLANYKEVPEIDQDTNLEFKGDGSQIGKDLIDNECEVIVLDNLSTGSLDDLRVYSSHYAKFLKGDILDIEILKEPSKMWK